MSFRSVEEVVVLDKDTRADGTGKVGDSVVLENAEAVVRVDGGGHREE